MAIPPGVRELAEPLEHLLRSEHGACGTVALLEWNAETDHQTVACHVKYRALMAKSDLGEQREVLVEKRHDLVGAQPLGDAGESAQIGEQHDRASANVGGGEEAVPQLRVAEDAIGELGRDVAPESAADLLVPHDLCLERCIGHLAARGGEARERLETREQELSRDLASDEVVRAGGERLD